MDWLDSYEIRARIIPSIVVCLPIMVPIFLLFKSVGDPISVFLFSGIVFIGMLYTVSFFIQNNGQKIQEQLWKSWDGPPATRILRWRDQTFDDQYKEKLHRSIKEFLGIDLLNKEEEQQNPDVADLKIDNAFFQARRFVYNNNPNDLLGKYNAEYGFHRNLLGSRLYWIFSSVIGIILCGFVSYKFGTVDFFSGTIVDTFLFFFAIIWGWEILPKTIVHPANYYARTLWESFYLIHDKK